MVLTLSRSGSFMSLPILAKRMLVSDDELDSGIGKAAQQGLVVVEEDERVGHVARLTDAGKMQAAGWQTEQEERAAHFPSPPTVEEKEALEAPMRKLLVSR